MYHFSLTEEIIEAIIPSTLWKRVSLIRFKADNDMVVSHVFLPDRSFESRFLWDRLELF